MKYYFQYYRKDCVVEDTEKITLAEALKLWDKHFDEVKEDLLEENKPQMAIFEATNEGYYGNVVKEIDHRDCFLRNGSIYTEILIYK